MQRYRFWLVLLVVFVVVIVISTGVFFWRHRQPLPPLEQVETYFAKEIAVLEELTAQIDFGNLSLKSPSLPDLSQVIGISPVLPSLVPLHELMARIKETEKHFSDSKAISAALIFSHPGSKSSIAVVHDDSLNIWSPGISSQTKVGSYISYCYSGLRQLVKYEKVISTESDQTYGFHLIFPPDLFTGG